MTALAVEKKFEHWILFLPAQSFTLGKLAVAE
jgi:hypothetical protein